MPVVHRDYSGDGRESASCNIRDGAAHHQEGLKAKQSPADDLCLRVEPQRAM